MRPLEELIGGRGQPSSPRSRGTAVSIYERYYRLVREEVDDEHEDRVRWRKVGELGRDGQWTSPPRWPSFMRERP